MGDPDVRIVMASELLPIACHTLQPDRIHDRLDETCMSQPPKWHRPKSPLGLESASPPSKPCKRRSLKLAGLPDKTVGSSG